MTSSEKAVHSLSFLLPDTHVVRKGIKQLFDALLAACAWMIADQLWFFSQLNIKKIIIWVILSTIVNALLQLTSPLYRLTAIRDITRIGFATFILLLLVLVTKLVGGPFGLDPQVPNIATVASLLTGMLWATARLGRRFYFENSTRRIFFGERRATPKSPTLLVGAGRAGSMVAQELIEHPELGYRIMGFLDDSPEKQAALISGIRVLGDTSQLREVTAKYGITHAVLALPTAPGQIVRKMVEDFRHLNVKVKTVPGIFNLLGQRTWKPDIQEISIEDVLRREPVQLDLGAMSRAVQGKTVLITGAGGSIGSELTRQVSGLGPASLVLLGRGENSLWQIQRDLQAHYAGQPFELALMDIRNREGLREIFERHRPHIVLHTAAHKHVPFLEIHPCEAVQNNIFGTLNVMEAARDFGAEKVVNISTDKAVNPTNVLGASKRIGECIVLNVAAQAAPGTTFVSVRFGNVLGSRGSVVPIFKEQIEHGGPITVTDESMTRFFMTIPEASQLVLQAALFGDTGRVYVLNMGDPIRIMDLATDMARLSGLTPGRDIKIEIMGLRPGEKLYEELFMEGERSAAHLHTKLMETNPQAIPGPLLEESLEAFRAATHLPFAERQPEIVKLFMKLVPSYKPSLLGVGKYGGHVKDRRQDPQGVDPEADRRGKA